jgi:hypothetical protein
MPRRDSLGVEVNARLEARTEKTRSDRCLAQHITLYAATCRSPLQPNMDFQFNIRSGGTLANRVHVDVDYDSRREFDASNAISVRYSGRGGEVLQSLEVGNVSFVTPPSRFITTGIPTGNYGVQAAARFGSLELRSIVARQTGNVVRDREFLLGNAAYQRVEREIEDHQVEPRRFFFVVDPRSLPGYPNIDILDAAEMRRAAASLPDSVRPSRVRLYRVLLGGPPPNPNGPRFRIIGDPASREGIVYEPLREQVDYYVDPSGLWVALARPLTLGRERLVAAWSVRLAGRDTVIPLGGGTPDLEAMPSRDQYAHLLWDPRIEPGDAAFSREIRSVYRIGGDEVRRETIGARIVTGASADLEKPKSGPFSTYLEMFGLAARANPANLDVENRVWPRAGDPILASGGDPAAAGRIVRDLFLVLPSLRPFSRSGLVFPGNPASDSLYRTPSEYLYSSQHPPSAYRLRLAYESDASASIEGTLSLGSVQVRPGSERLLMDGVPLVRGSDYTVDYDLGIVSFIRPDTLFAVRRRVTARFEENPLFLTTPTSIFGLASRYPLPNGEVGFTAIAQGQRSAFTRPPLGFEPATSLVGGFHGDVAWALAPLSRMLARLPGASGLQPAHLRLRGEVAASAPRFAGGQQAYLESFEGEGGFNVNLAESAWYLSSRPFEGTVLAARVGASSLDLARASTLAWQNTGRGADDRAVTYSIEQIDPRSVVIGTGFSAEQILWMTLYPLRVAAVGSTRWSVPAAPPGRRWRSLRIPLGTTGGGADLSRVEQVEFWTAIDTLAARRSANPVLVLDIGEISENTVAFSPESLFVAGADTTFRGKRIVRLDTLDTERDPLSRSFDVSRDDDGLPGDVAPSITVVSGAVSERRLGVPLCRRTGDLPRLGDAATNCTVGNDRLDEEDLDGDGVLNLPDALRDRERIARFIVDLSSPASFARIGKCGVGFGAAPERTVAAGLPGPAPVDSSTRCWVLVRASLDAPDETFNAPNLRRARGLRLTMISGAGAEDDRFSLLPIARFRFVGAPWLSRSDRPLQGVAGDVTSPGFVIAAVVGTQDSDSLGLNYTPPPGVTDQPDIRRTGLETGRTVINERSLRLLAGGLRPLDRAEAYYRFPEGQRSFLTYRELRVWARGRGDGWGPGGELNFFVKVGRDEDNFYLYRTPVNAGDGVAAWLPEVVVQLEKFQALRARLENSLLGRADTIGCTGVDSMIVLRAGLPAGAGFSRRAACDGGYIVYSADPVAGAPNLAAVQEMAVGMLRVDAGGPMTFSADTLELWVDDIRLANVVSSAGFAGHIGAHVVAGDLGDLRVNLVRRDPMFRQLAEAPSFSDDAAVEIGSTIRLERLLPGGSGLAAPLSISHTSSATDPYLVSQADFRGSAVSGLREPRQSATSLSLSVRRLEPRGGSLLGTLLDHLGATATLDHLSSKAEYQRAGSTRLTAGVEFLRRLPAEPSWTVPAVRLFTGIVRADDRRESFLLPANTAIESGRSVRGRERLWRSGGSLELRPLEYATVRWNATSVRDLRNFGGSSLPSRVASREQKELLGVGLGLERERVMQAAVSLTPQLRPWLRANLEGSSSFGSTRDPSTRFLVTTDSSLPVSDSASYAADEVRLPLRLTGSRQATAGLVFSAARLVGESNGAAGARVLRALQPLELQTTRTQLAAFDAIAHDAPFTMQVGAGGADDYRELSGRLAASASDATSYSANGGISLPLGLSLSTRATLLNGATWMRIPGNDAGEITTRQWTVPDAAARWQLTGARGPLTSASATVRAVQSRQEVVMPVPGEAGDLRITRLWRYPVSATVRWDALGGLVTSAGFSWTNRVDSLPGSQRRSRATDASADIARTFRPPASWGFRGDIRSRLGWQESHGESFVTARAAPGGESRLTDNGRRALTISADTGIDDGMTFTLQGSHILNFDRTVNRRIAQTVLSAVLTINFFAGEIR